MQSEIERRARVMAVHSDGDESRWSEYMESAECDIVSEAISASDEPDRMKELLWYLFERLTGRIKI
jgi:hypothetical protein